MRRKKLDGTDEFYQERSGAPFASGDGYPGVQDASYEEEQRPEEPFVSQAPAYSAVPPDDPMADPQDQPGEEWPDEALYPDAYAPEADWTGESLPPEAEKPPRPPEN